MLFFSSPYALGGMCLVGLLFAVKALARRRGATSSLCLASDDACAPGETVRAWLESEARLLRVQAVLELRRKGEGAPARSVPAAVVVSEPLSNGWRCAVEAVLPEDAAPGFEGGWSFSVTAVADGGGVVRQTAPIELRPFYLKPSGPRAPGAPVRALLELQERPPALEASLDLFHDDTYEAVRSVPARVCAAEKASCGWRCVVEAVLPADARAEFEAQWVLRVHDAGGKMDDQDLSVDEQERVNLSAPGL